MFTNKKIATAVRLACIASVSASAFSAQTAFAADEQVTENVERIAVTGSRIKRADMEGANPVQLITREDMLTSGISNVGDLLQEIPSVAGAATNTSINNGGSGAVRVSLRGLGSDRTLVLLNGRRMVGSGTGADSSVDLSTIPTSIIKRVEVLKDGASAIYGSDAIGGVVNIITRDDFEGAEFSVSNDQSTHGGDGAQRNIDFTVGTAGEKGNVVFNAYYAKQEPQWSGDRDWSKFELALDGDGKTLNKRGSSAPPWGRYNGIDGQVNGKDCSSFTHGAGAGPGQSDPTNFTNPNGYDCWDWDKDTYNYAPANYHLLPVERYGMFAQGSYELTENTRFFSELMYSHREASTKLAPEPLAPLAFFGYEGATYSKDNYYNQQFGPKDKNGNSVDIADWRRRVVETGGRSDNRALNTYRFAAGFDGEFDNGWGYEISYIYGRNEASNRAGGNFNLEKVAQAVGPSFKDADGNIVCGTPDKPIADCVSLNTFGTPGSDSEISQKMLDFVTFEGHDIGTNEQQIVSASVFGEAFELPSGTVGIAVGLEHREEKGADFPDALVALGKTTGSTRSATQGSYTVDEAYFEANIPLLSGMTGAENLEMDIAVRYSDYDTFGDTTNHKVGIKWQPVDNVLVRGTVSTAFRAPSTSDLFAGAAANSPTVADKCATNPTSHCLADGVPAAGFEPIGDQLSSTRGGNDKLQPEEADIFTMGLVYSPEFVDGLEFTVDFWNIELTNAISTLGEQIILDNCALKGQDCDKITRYTSGPLAGNSKDINDRNLNVGGVDSSGYDFNIRYSTETAWGDLRVNLDTTYYSKYDKTLADGTVQKHAGKFLRGGDGNFPEIKSNLDVNLSNDDWAANWAIRYIDSVDEPFAFDDGREWRAIDSQTIHDARFSYFYENITASVGLNNIFDEDPPYAATGFNDNTDPRTYNTTGRHWYVNMMVKF